MRAVELKVTKQSSVLLGRSLPRVTAHRLPRAAPRIPALMESSFGVPLYLCIGDPGRENVTEGRGFRAVGFQDSGGFA